MSKRKARKKGVVDGVVDSVKSAPDVIGRGVTRVTKKVKVTLVKISRQLSRMTKEDLDWLSSELEKLQIGSQDSNEMTHVVPPAPMRYSHPKKRATHAPKKTSQKQTKKQASKRKKAKKNKA